jgi:outer membrane lipoprotein carrier protein
MFLRAISIGLGLALSFLLVHAESAAAAPGQFDCRGAQLAQSEGGKVLTQVETRYTQLKTLEARFVQDSYLAALDASERSSGEMRFKKPGRMRWEYSAPETQTFLVRDSTVWFYQPEANQVLIDEFRDVLITDLPVAFLMGLGGLSEKFTVSKACLDGDNVVLELRPRGASADEALKGFTLKVDRERLPVGAQVVDVGGNVTAIQFADRKFDREFSDDVFRTDLPAGTDINDQRGRKGV